MISITKEAGGTRSSIAISNERSTSKYARNSFESFEEWPRDASQNSTRSDNYRKTTRDTLEAKKLFRRRPNPSNCENSSTDDIVVVGVPEIIPCHSMRSDTSGSTVTTSVSTSFDSDAEALHKLYYTHNISRPTVMQGQVAQAATAASAKALQHHVHPQKESMKRHRRDKTATLGMVGAGVGTLILPVIGTVVGGVITGYATNQSLKRYEKKIQRKWERDQFQKDASASQAARFAVFA